MNKKFLPYYMVLILCLLMQAQYRAVAQHLTLEEAILLAQDSTLLAFQSRYDYQRQWWEYQTYRASRGPQFNLSARPLYTRMCYETASNYVSPQQYHLLGTDVTLSYQQQMSRWGGYLYADSKGVWSELLGTLRDQYDADRLIGTMPLRVGYRQSLMGYNPFRWESAIKDKRMHRAEKELKYRMLQIAEQTTAYYFQYLSAQEYYQIYQQNYLTTDTLYHISEQKFMLTTVTKEELMSLQLERMNAKTQADNAYAELQNARYSLLSYLHLPDVGQTLTLTRPEVPETFAPDIEQSVAKALRNNPEVLGYSEQILEAEQALELARKQSGLQVNLDVSVGLQNYTTRLGDAYRDLEQYTLAQVGISIPIYDGHLAKARKKQARFALEAVQQALLEQERITREAVVTTIQLLTTRHQTIPSALAGQALADEAFRLIQQRYANGQIDINTYMLAQSRKDQAHALCTELLCNFWMNYYHLCRMTME